MKAPREPLFLARASYRRRRLFDVATILPFVALFLFFLPVLWADDAPMRTAWGGAYVFAAWAALIAAAALLSRLLTVTGSDDRTDDD